MIIGYTTGVFDMFHIGHLNLLKRAKEQCDFLIVGVSTDEVVQKNKRKTPVIPFAERCQIVESIKYVDKVIAQTSYDIEGKINAVLNNQVNCLFVGTDWQGTDKWNRIESILHQYGCKVVYLPHTDGISSTELVNRIKADKKNDL